jgi:hypothetical protein
MVTSKGGKQAESGEVANITSGGVHVFTVSSKVKKLLQPRLSVISKLIGKMPKRV